MKAIMCIYELQEQLKAKKTFNQRVKLIEDAIEKTNMAGRYKGKKKDLDKMHDILELVTKINACKTNKIAHIEIVGKRWFQKSFGNTYNSSHITVYFDNGNHYAEFYLPQTYGYGSYYKQRSIEFLESWGILKSKKILITDHVIDVRKESDL